MTKIPANFRLSIQAAPAFILNEGTDAALDFLAGNGLDAIHLNSHTYYGGGGGMRDTQRWATDHPPAKGFAGLAERAWMRHDPARFRGVGLFHRYPPDEAAGPDPFAAILYAARARGLKVHVRYLDGWEPHRQAMPEWREVAAHTLAGDALPIPCFSQERVREWWRITVEEMAERYAIDGLFYGIERGSPLSDVLFWDQPPRCFCGACRAQAAREGIDADRAAEGLRRLHELTRTAAAGEPADAPYLAMVLRVLVEYPDVLSWDALAERSKKAMERIGRDALKKARPAAAFTAIIHQEVDLVKRAHEDWAWHAEHADAVVLRLYEHIAGPRLLEWAAKRNARTVLRGLSTAARRELAWHGATSGPEPCPGAKDLRRGMPPAHAAAETARCVELCGGRAEVQVAVGVDITHPFKRRIQTPPAYVEAVVRGARRAGARAVILCREYQEVSGASMRAAARAMREGR